MHEIINVKDVRMDFIMENDKIKSIKEYMISVFKRQIKRKTFTALHSISFTLERGDVLGVIGHNGAGKSTLLKIISGILKPTGGTVLVQGNIVPMLELGSGFDQDMTGRENIFLNGAILGYSREFLESKYDDILEFSGLHEFINIPLRNYSSGMVARLAFSIATMVNPEILIVDEILSVGDADFQSKSRDRMLKMMGGGTTVLFVSHSLSQIREMCNKTLWIEHGEMQAFGDTIRICDAYERNLSPINIVEANGITVLHKGN